MKQNQELRDPTSDNLPADIELLMSTLSRLGALAHTIHQCNGNRHWKDESECSGGCNVDNVETYKEGNQAGPETKKDGAIYTPVHTHERNGAIQARTTNFYVKYIPKP
ncbi:hypothetical protein KKE34_00850 [Patescibacteria group bacterium]|nr:hypothetical protein [Patescibacteria group bacterium]MBU1885138.1 hypothetical protein [Patescibacteria group bacterium]